MSAAPLVLCTYCGANASTAGHRTYCIYHDEQTCPTCHNLNELQVPIDRMVYYNAVAKAGRGAFDPPGSDHNPDNS